MATVEAPSTSERQHYALQTIFSFFLGLMVLAVVGVGVNTFYPSPVQTYQEQMTKIQRQMEMLNVKSPTGTPTDAGDRAKLARLQAQQNVLQEKIDKLMKEWQRNTSIVLVLCATLVMGISLLLNEQLRVISNGLLLGGLFIMVYGVGWVVFSGSSTARFVVVLFALVVALSLGYLKFVRGREAKEAVSAAPATVGIAGAADTVAVSGLEQRVATLEARLSAVSSALRGDDTAE